MLGNKIYKPVETQEQLDEYSTLAEWCNSNNATIEDKGEYYEVVAIPAPTQKEKNEAEIVRLKAELAATDYKCMKFVDGALTEKEYAKVREQRAKIRERINALEK